MEAAECARILPGNSSLSGNQQLNYHSLEHNPTKPSTEVKGYQRKTWKAFLCHSVSVLTLGLPLVIFHWKPHLEVYAKCTPCPLRQADWVLIRDQLGRCFAARVQTEQIEDGSLESRSDEGRSAIAVGVSDDQARSQDTIQLHEKEEKNILRYYAFEGVHYLWVERRQAYCKASTLNEGWMCSDLRHSCGGLSVEEQSARKVIYGPNLIDVPVKSYLWMLMDEILNLFYIFQVFSITLWICEEYYSYAACIFIISTISIGLSLYVTKKQNRTLRDIAKVVSSVQICRPSGERVVVSSVDLVPGDVLVVSPEGMLVPCDAALLNGECVVNESLLTGESTPVLKTPLPQDPEEANATYSPEDHKRHTLFCGTQVIQARSCGDADILAVVTRTGFYTAKGDLISSILHPKPVKLRFHNDAWKFVSFLAILAVIGTIYSIIILKRNKVSRWLIALRALDIVTVVVPPALPAAMTMGTMYAQTRLKRQGIFCVSPQRIDLCGKVRLVCFDKTGTLTADGMDIWGVVPQAGSSFLPIVHQLRQLADGPLLRCLATCHTLSLLGNQPIGDPLDLRMLESTGWSLVETEGPEVKASLEQDFGTGALLVVAPPLPREQLPGMKPAVPMAVLRRFPFSSALRRMSVLGKAPGNSPVEAFMKGAPETVASLCQKASVPQDFPQQLCQFTSNGFRVLALAYKPSVAVGSFEEAQEVTRDWVETDMVFLGLLVLKNVLKPETTPVIRVLRSAGIQTVMVTGDNMLTAVNVARSCQMLQAQERVVFVNAAPPSRGKAAALTFTPSEQAKLQILVQTTIFAQMLPDQKTRLVEHLQHLNYCVAMCGDGANDCGALKAADVGISLSEAEASAAAPFTSQRANIECIPITIREGRCSLVTSFGLFKYMAFYSLTQFVSVLLLYTLNTNLSDGQFLFIDLIITTTMVALMGKTGPAEDLGLKRPQGALLSLAVLGSLCLQMALIVAVLVIIYFITVSQQWFTPLNSTLSAPANLPNYENTVVFCTSGFQYLILAVVVSKGRPFRKPLYTNVPFLMALLLLAGVMIWLTVYPLTFMQKLLHLKSAGDLNFKVILLGMAALHFFTAFVLEVGLDHGLLNGFRKLRPKKASKKLYKQLQWELSQEKSLWPPLHAPLFAPTRISPATR
ncbi:PREDICTED: probable cation-transporting ATPase 13A2 [Thamnophis sirtalis]|uniref:Probable cation-transporting ATPase 13A2 n=1 Tax=Thamnophis sirtalis TaxID=35019 RepID=A0A6I9Y084_9SAUR|nr:PREDICTED: probable cation-transporting ATPase 13A2 [Thamnophis sirtalis]